MTSTCQGWQQTGQSCTYVWRLPPPSSTSRSTSSPQYGQQSGISSAISDDSSVTRIRNCRQDHAGDEHEDRVREEIGIDDQNRSDDEMDRTGLPFSVNQVDRTDRSEKQS